MIIPFAAGPVRLFSVDLWQKSARFGLCRHPEWKRLYPLYEEAEGKFPIYFHIGDNRPQYQFSKPKKLRKILDEFPRLQVVAAHLGGYMTSEEGVEYLSGHENVWYDTSSALWAMSPEKAEYLISKFGAEKVMFGTDYPVMCPHDELELFFKINLSEF